MQKLSLTILSISLLAACGAPLDDGGQLPRQKGQPGKADSSAEAVFLDFEFDGEVQVTSTWNAKQLIEDQLLYTVGQLNGEKSVGRLDRLELSNIKTNNIGGVVRVTYHAKMPVAWGRPSAAPQSYTLTMPRDLSYAGQQQFTAKYSGSCVDAGAHDVDVGSMWYYYRPNAWNCDLAPEDVVSLGASVGPSAIQTTGKFPEYDRVWSDQSLKVVAVFGKYEDGATANSDGGIAAYNSFTRSIANLLGGGVQSNPANVPYSPGVGMPDIEFSVALADGRTVEVVALLVDNVRTAGFAFDQRYRQLSRDADLIAYNGHAGLGANIRALARKGEWITGQYAIVFMNGCDTYAYVDSALADAHAAVNADDPKGTKYVDIVMNAMPASFYSVSSSTMALIAGLLAHQTPKTYEQIFAGIDHNQVVLVSGEEDNTFVPGGGGGGGGIDNWEGFDEQGSVVANQELRYSTPKLAAGRYRFELSGSGDADLYLRIGEAPTVDVYDCRPYRYGSAESCAVDLPTDAEIHVMVRGWDPTSAFRLTGSAQ